MSEHTPSPHEREKRQDAVLDEVLREMARQDNRWGERNHPNGTGAHRRPLRGLATYYEDQAQTSLNPATVRADLLRDLATADCQRRSGPMLSDTWTAILLEEVFEALAENEHAKLRAELLQVAAVATQWVLAIDRRDA